ncbi:zonular occludens toxin domain-containing protein [Methylomonas sp. AM2-LC]|uniref:zonular occludens toxin family protein n=1 Tax=Methylomonas sp. AM2-LC TaxID=3153301 RepID=UPI003264AEFF
MATAIHHGAYGSFKTFSLIQRFAIPALLDGRTVVHNVRGFSFDLVKKNFPDYVFPDTAKVLSLNTDIKENRPIMARWFHWVPLGSLVIIDEAQRIYPKRREFKISDLDQAQYPDGYIPDVIDVSYIDETTGELIRAGRPESFETAVDMQRHYNWDLFLSTPAISKISDEFREGAEYGYLHKSLSGKLPFLFKNSWYEFQHHPSNNGVAKSNQNGTPRRYKADEKVFKCYRSTITGKHVDSKAGLNALNDPAVIGKLALVVISFLLLGVLALYNLNKQTDNQKDIVPTVLESPPPTVVIPVSSQKDTITPPDGSLHNVSNREGGSHDLLAGFRIVSIAKQFLDNPDINHIEFLTDTTDDLQTVSYKRLASLGIRLAIHGLCDISLVATSGQVLKLGCFSNIIRYCHATLDTDRSYSARGCSKLPKPKLDTRINATAPPPNAIVTAANNVIGK